MAPAAPSLTSRHRLAVIGVGADDAGQAVFQVCNAGSQAEDSHDLAGHRDVKAVLPGGAVHLAAQAVHDKTQLTVVHIHVVLPGDAAGVDVQGVALLDAVVDHGNQQVVGRANGVQVTGKVQVDILHGHHLGIAAARSAALDAEHRPQGRLTQAELRLLPRAFMASARPTLVVVLPSPAGVGLMAVTRIACPVCPPCGSDDG